MDPDTPDLSDITNMHPRPSVTPHSNRNSVFRSDIPQQFRDSVRDAESSSASYPHEDEDDKPWGKPLDFGSVASTTLPGPSDDDGEDDDRDAGFDVPDRLTIGPGAAAARLDLHRCTIRVHKQLVDQIKTHSMKPAQSGQMDLHAANTPEELSRCQGELWLKSRVPMLGWKKRYGSIVDHAFFGPVLFLFKYDAKGNVALHHSMMIVLVDSHVRLGKNSTTKDRDYRCEFVLKTTKRRYLIAANHTMRRDYWLRNLESITQQATTNHSGHGR